MTSTEVVLSSTFGSFKPSSESELNFLRVPSIRSMRALLSYMSLMSSSSSSSSSDVDRADFLCAKFVAALVTKGAKSSESEESDGESTS